MNYKKFLVNELVKPIGRRLGSFIAGSLLALGATSDLGQQVELLVPALLAFLADLVLSHISRGRG